MAKYDVKMSCGHTETIQLFGKMTDRDKKIAWLGEHGICTACYKARKEAAHAAETAAAKAQAEADNLPNLTGSEKQINWALAIRAKKFTDLDSKLAAMNAKVTDEQQQRKNQIALQAMRNVLASKTESRFWIDNRDVEASRLIANNNLQDDLKAEFARLTAEADAKAENNNTNDAIIDATDDYAVTAEAQDAAVEAEIEAAANNTEEVITMTTIETKIASNGSTYYYVREDGKLRRISSKEATRLTIDNILDDRDATQAITDAIDEYIVTAEAQDAAADAEIEAANNNTEEDNTMTDNNTKAAKIAAIENAIQAVIAERNEAYDELAAAEDNEEIAQWWIDQLKENIADLGNQYWELVAELDAAKAEPDDDDDDPEPPTNDTPETDGSEDDDAPEYAEPAIGTTGGLPDLYEVTEYTDNGYGKRYTAFGNLRDAFNFANASIFPADITLIQGEQCYFICDNSGEFVTHREKFARAVHCLIEERDNVSTFDILPSVDELNDVDDDEPIAAPLTEELRFTPYGNVRQRLYIGDEKIRFFDDEFLGLWSGKYRVGVHQLGRNNVHVAIDDEDGGSHFEEFDMDNLPEEFWSLMTERGACSIDEPVDDPPTTNDAPDTLAAVAETIQDLNDHAPDGWEVFYNADNKNFTVAFDEKPVANLDSLALLKILPPDEFFSKFQSSADEQFTADRVDEVAALKEMRKQLAGDKERLKIIDDLINDATRAAILG